MADCRVSELLDRSLRGVDLETLSTDGVQSLSNRPPSSALVQGVKFLVFIASPEAEQNVPDLIAK
jgi:hypothetical protein